jgi:hypothetical protein
MVDIVGQSYFFVRGRPYFVFDGPLGFTGTIGSGAKSCASTSGAGSFPGGGFHAGAPAASAQQRNETK